jgi:hypothetical protein
MKQYILGARAVDIDTDANAFYDVASAAASVEIKPHLA